MNRFLVILILFWGYNTCFAQSSEKYNSDYVDFYRGEELFAKEQYAAARKEFRNFINSYPHPTDPLYIKALYYEGVSALELFNNDAVELLEEFNRNYPESIYRKVIYFRLGKYYYQKKDYKEALVWFNKLKGADVEPADLEEFYFKVGYSNFHEGNMEAAKSAFFEVKDGISEYAGPALYYYSHIAYQEGSYQTALEGFLKLQNDERFAKLVPYYIAQIYYLQGRYDEVTEYATKIDPSDNVVNEADMNHLIGDAYYKTGRYQEAVPYLEAYNKKSKTTRDDDYQLAFAMYKSGSFDRAIPYFDRVTKKEDSLGQVAYYHIGECYLALKNPISARGAFERAANIEADDKVAEDALYNVAVLSYKLDINPYNEAVKAFEAYLERYPNSARKNDVYQYLVNVYSSTNNYKKALESIDKLPNKDIKMKAAYQLIAFNYGVELYHKNKYADAISAFQLVDKYPMDPIIGGKAKYWSADAQFQAGNYNAAISGYRQFINIPGTLLNDLRTTSYYNIGYAYLNLKDTSQAIEAFRLFTQAPSHPTRVKLVDANMRIADGYYILKQNDLAIRFYTDAYNLKAGFEDQALYYMALTYGIKGDNSNKINSLRNITTNYKTSKYLQAAIYELGLTYKHNGDYTNALSYFNRIITDYPQSAVVLEAKLQIADIYYKKQELTRAESMYREILSANSSDNHICTIAVSGLKDVYVAMNKPEKVEQLANQYACANFSELEREDLYFKPAYQAYENKNYVDAIPKLRTYLEKFPTGLYHIEATIYLANSHYELNQMEEAITVYRKALEEPTNMYTENAAIRVAKYLYNNERYAEALGYYERLDQVSSDPEVIFNTQLGLMRCNFLLEHYEATVPHAQKVLTSSQLNSTYRREAEYAKGMSNFYIEHFDDALPSLVWLTKNTTDETASEANYYIAEIHFKRGDLDKADSEARNLLKRKPSYDYWIAKALILQSRILILKDDLFQAEQTLRSVIDNYPVQDDGILDEANVLYDELMQMKNQPKNLIENGTNVIEINENEGGN